MAVTMLALWAKLSHLALRMATYWSCISGSGETEQLIAFTKNARKVGANIVLISAKSASTIGDLADAVFQIGSSEQYGKVLGMPMGTVFELSTLFFLEATISHIIHEKEFLKKS